MDKRIVELSSDPFSVGLADRPCSLFIDPSTGNTLIDEGEGEDRMNGAVLFPDKGPRFSVAMSDSLGAELHLQCRTFRWVVGSVQEVSKAEEWAALANAFLVSKAGSGGVPASIPSDRAQTGESGAGQPAVNAEATAVPHTNGAPTETNGPGDSHW